MNDLAPPRTPTPGAGTGTGTTASSMDRKSQDEGAGAMTPPPSDRKERLSSTYNDEPLSTSVPVPATPKRHSSTSSRDKTDWTGGSSLIGLSPTVEQIQDMSEHQLRDLVTDLVPAFGQARMELAHTRLQLQLLSIETHEQAQRAEVEHDMTRKELEILQAGSPVIQGRAMISPDPRSSLGQLQRQLNEALEHGRQLESENGAAELRLKDAKRVIRYLDNQVKELKDRNQMLRDRVRDNREHLNAMRASGLLRSTPGSPKSGQNLGASHSIDHYATPARPRKQSESLHAQSRNSQLITPTTARPQDDPFGALLFAGQVLNAQQQHQQRASGPSTPSPTRVKRQTPGHSRASMSMSSLPSTPKAAQFAPINAANRPILSQQAHDKQARRNSGSTISDSQDSRAELVSSRAAGLEDDSISDEDMQESQASQAASKMLKKQVSRDGYRQTKITGKVVKHSNKRALSGAGSGHDFESTKKQKTAGSDGMGLGIGV